MKSYVYLIKSEDTNYYKVGVSRNVAKRIKQLQTGNQNKLVLINKYETDESISKKIESTYHRLHSHLNSNGEWFELSLYDEMNFIKECKKVEKNFNYLNNDNDNFLL